MTLDELAADLIRRGYSGAGDDSLIAPNGYRQTGVLRRGDAVFMAQAVGQRIRQLQADRSLADRRSLAGLILTSKPTRF